MNRTQYKQIWYLIIKLTIVFGAGYFIYQHTTVNGKFPKDELFFLIKNKLLNRVDTVLVLLIMTIINWLLEIKKWQSLVGNLQPIGYRQAAKESLGSHTISLFTPFKTGEYAGKVLYYPKYLRKKIILLNFIGNLSQLIITVLFGVLGLVFFILHFDISIQPHRIRRIAYLFAFLIISLFAGKKAMSYTSGRYYQKAILFLKKINRSLKIKIVFLSFLRYVVFSHQFYFLLIVFGIEIRYETALLLIFTMYFMAIMFPIFSLFDFVIKGSFAIYLFSFAGGNEMIIMLISTLMWLLNFALPALVGSYFVLLYKPIIKAKFV